MQPNISVGILNAEKISFRLSGRFLHTASERYFEGEAEAELHDKLFILRVAGQTIETSLPAVFHPEDPSACFFDLEQVVIGIDFHWQRKETQRFNGSLKIMQEDGRLWAVNILPVEDYLTSVISSEMSATSNVPLLKAHAVIARSWLLAQIQKEKGDKPPKEVRPPSETRTAPTEETIAEHIRWYDREDHRLFDVCADDHCQRYQGISRISSQAAVAAVKETAGIVLSHEGKICDTRYSKCCGGLSEQFENVWNPQKHAYLSKIVDNHREPPGFDTHLDSEEKARAWILESPEAFCNTTDKEVLSQVLNDYDQETPDFFRWQVSYTQEEMQRLLHKRIGFDAGEVISLEPVERGASGRLTRLKITGSKQSIIIGKELEIRKALSDSHLYSSAFVVETHDHLGNVPGRFTLKGAGWGHGVGLCQIGAAVMGARDYTWQEILMHYFRGATIEKWY